MTPQTLKSQLKLLAKLYPNYKTELTYKNPYELLVAVILSAQCTDARVNLTTPKLFETYPTPASLAKADRKDVEQLIKSCGFYRMKAQAIQEASRDLVERFGGKVPKTLEELTTLRGVGRKTASVVLNQAFDIPAIAVDTHVKRVSFRLGWTENTNPEKIEQDLRKLLPVDYWAPINGRLILHGRRICKAQKPKCGECPLNTSCPFANGQLG